MNTRLKWKKKQLSKIIGINDICYQKKQKNAKRMQTTAKFSNHVFAMTRKDTNLFV